MEKECKGLMGKIFGHDIKSLLKKYNPSRVADIDVEVHDLSSFIKANAKKEYEIICVRCGEKYDK